MNQITLCGLPSTLYSVKHGTSKAEERAAQILTSHFEKINGQPFVGGSGVIELFVDPTLKEADSFTIQNTKGLLQIKGSNGRGLIYGVYDLLETYLGTRFFFPGVEKTGEAADIPELQKHQAPIFEYRQGDWVALRNADWCVANHINNYSFLDETYGGHIKWGSFVHTMHQITGCDAGTQPCLSDPVVLEQAIAYVRGILEKDPTVNLISVSQNDNENFCKCPKCAAVDEEEGSHMGTLLRLVNAVAENIKDDYPNVAIETLAYRYTRKPPKITKPLPNVVIRLCSIECCFSHPLSDESCSCNVSFKHDIEEWSKICNRLYIWDYVTDFAFYIPTFPNFGVLRENMRFFAVNHVKGMYPEGNYESISGEFGELRAYLLAKLMWDPMMSERRYQEHIDEFLEAYYGAGWRYIRAYLDHAVGCARRKHMQIYNAPFRFITKETYETLYDTFEDWWNKAEELAGDRVEAVKQSRLQWTYLSLCVKPDYQKGRDFYDHINARNIQWRESIHRQPDDEDFGKPPFEWKFRNRKN